MNAAASTISDRDYSAAAHQYAVDVTVGKIPAGVDLILACRRYLDDLERADFKYYYDRDAAHRACRFIEKMPHTRGRWANRKNSFIDLEPWQCFLICNIFGWLEKNSGLRRFLEVFLFVARKNAKSTTAAAIGLYMLVLSGEYAPEVFCGATTEKQAQEIFNTARRMAEKRPALCERFNLDVRASQILQLGEGGKMTCVVGKPGDGASPSCWLTDEYHEHPTDAQYETAVSGMGAREQPLMFVLTTAGVDLSYPCYSYFCEAQQMLRGASDMNERFFPLIYQIDDDDDIYDVEALKKANPNYGVSVSESYLAGRIAKAKSSPRKRADYETKHCNRWVSSGTSWVDSSLWSSACDENLKIEDFYDDELIVGWDLAERLDFLAAVFVFRRVVNGVFHYFVFPYLFLPEKTIEMSDKYSSWYASGLIHEIPGSEMNQEAVSAVIDPILKNCTNCLELTFDPWKAKDYYRHYENINKDEPYDVVEFRQITEYISPPMREIEAALSAGRLTHGGSLVLTWMMLNVVCKEDANRNIFARRPNAASKIDGAIAMIIAIGRFLDRPEPAGPRFTKSFRML